MDSRAFAFEEATRPKSRRCLRGAAARAGEPAARGEVHVDVELACLRIEVAAGPLPTAARGPMPIAAGWCLASLLSPQLPDLPDPGAVLAAVKDAARRLRRWPRRRRRGHPSGQARGQALDLGCARRLGEIQAGTKTAPFGRTKQHWLKDQATPLPPTPNSEEEKTVIRLSADARARLLRSHRRPNRDLWATAYPRPRLPSGR